jgi:hypothetical protein
LQQAVQRIQWSRWSADRPDIFSLKAFQVPRPEDLLVSAPGIDSFREAVVEVAILAKENLQNRIAVGRVTVYLPVPAR